MEPQIRRRAAWADIREFLVRAGALAALLVMLFGVVFGLYIQPDAAMHPHLKPGDLLLFYRLPRSCTAGKVVVFTKDGQRRTGRVAARGGETPKYDSNVTYPLTLADGEYFILCDARAGARDSRWFGPVQAGEIQGRVIAVLRRNGI